MCDLPFFSFTAAAVSTTKQHNVTTIKKSTTIFLQLWIRTNSIVGQSFRNSVLNATKPQFYCFSVYVSYLTPKQRKISREFLNIFLLVKKITRIVTQYTHAHKGK